MTTKKAKGRPSKFTPELAEEICDLMSQGWTLRRIGKRDDMPDRNTILRWLKTNEVFRSQYAQAREYMIDHWADEILDISDDSTNDTFVDDNGRTRTDHDVVHRSRLRVDTRKWLMSKLAPRKYGDKFEDEKTEDKKPESVIIQVMPRPEKN